MPPRWGRRRSARLAPFTAISCDNLPSNGARLRAAVLAVARYRAALMARFANPALRHRTRQIAVDGSQKLRQRLLAPTADRIASFDALALAVARSMRWVQGCDDRAIGTNWTICRASSLPPRCGGRQPRPACRCVAGDHGDLLPKLIIVLAYYKRVFLSGNTAAPDSSI